MGLEGEIKVFSASENFRYVCSLEVEKVPVSLIYHPSMH